MDVFSEVSILERFRGQQSVCQLLNYGLEGDSIVLVMRKYTASLKAWRARITSPLAQQLRLYLHIFADIVAAKQVTFLMLLSSDHTPMLCCQCSFGFPDTCWAMLNIFRCPPHSQYSL